MSVYDDRIVNPLMTGKLGISTLINKVLERFPNELPVNPNWIISPYAPTIIEAAKSLYENHTVEDITRHEADKDLLLFTEFNADSHRHILPLKFSEIFSF